MANFVLGQYAPLAKPAICSTHRKSYAQAAPIFIAGGGQAGHGHFVPPIASAPAQPPHQNQESSSQTKRQPQPDQPPNPPNNPRNS